MSICHSKPLGKPLVLQETITALACLQAHLILYYIVHKFFTKCYCNDVIWQPHTRNVVLIQFITDMLKALLVPMETCHHLYILECVFWYFVCVLACAYFVALRESPR